MMSVVGIGGMVDGVIVGVVEMIVGVVEMIVAIVETIVARTSRDSTADTTI